jgi:iron(III) transport system permease protein
MLLNSIVLGLLTVLFCGIVGTGLAFLVHYFEFPYRKVIDKILILPIMLPGLIIVFAFVQLYGESGIITQGIKLLFDLDEVPFHFKGLGGILFVHTYTQYVYFYLNTSIAIKQLDQSVIEASQNLGASKWQVFKTILIPFLKPALIASSIVTFMSGIGSFSAPSIIGGNYRVMTVQILMSKANNYMSLAAMQVVILSIASLSFLWVLKQYEKRIQFRSSVRGGQFKAIVLKRHSYKYLQYGIVSLLCILIILPVLMILVGSFVKSGTWMVEIFPKHFSFENYQKIFVKSRAFAPFKNSITMALIASGMVLVVGLPSSAVITKSNYRSKAFVEFLVMLPWTMPASAIAINTINAYNKATIFSLNQVLVGSYILLPIAYFVSAIPIMVRTLNVSMNGLNDTYLEASRSLGANRLLTVKNIAIPIVSPGIIAGVLLVFIRSIGEYTMSAFLYTVSNKPISIAMVNSIFEYDIGLAMTYGSLLVILSTLLSSIAYRLLPFGRKM